MKNKSPLVCILIINWNGLTITKDCLESIFKNTKYNNFKVILLDNGSSDKSLEEISNFKNIELIKLNKNVGYSPAMNILWRYSINKYNPVYLCNLNNDLILNQPEWLDLLVNEMEKNLDYGISGNKLIFPDGRVQILFTDLDSNKIKYDSNEKYDFVKQVKSISGTSMFVRRSIIEKIGALDENFFYGADDLDYCLRTNKAGIKILYNGKCEMVHLGSFSYRKSKRDFIYMHQSYCQMVFAFRYYGFFSKIKMPLIQLTRAFVTRKIPYEPRSRKNTDIHWNIFKRLSLFFRSFFKAIKDYKHINQDYFLGKKPEPKNI